MTLIYYGLVFTEIFNKTWLTVAFLIHMVYNFMTFLTYMKGLLFRHIGLLFIKTGFF